MKTTLFDGLHGLKEECVQLGSKRARTVTAVEVACKLDGVLHTSGSTIKHSATTADILDCRGIRETGNMMGEENPKLTFHRYKRKQCDLEALTLEKSSAVIHFLVFRAYIKIASIKLETAFMNAESDRGSFSNLFTCKVNTFILKDNLKQLDSRIF